MFGSHEAGVWLAALAASPSPGPGMPDKRGNVVGHTITILA
jgi:hypothetical protein